MAWLIDQEIRDIILEAEARAADIPNRKREVLERDAVERIIEGGGTDHR